MKIRTEDELQDVIDSEIAWRKKELSAVKANINTARNLQRIQRCVLELLCFMHIGKVR